MLQLTRLTIVTVSSVAIAGCGTSTSEKAVPSFAAVDAKLLEPLKQEARTQPSPFLESANHKIKIHNRLKGHSGEVNCLAFSPDGKFLVSGSYGDRTLRIWDVVEGQELSHRKTEHRITSLALTPDGKTIITGDVYQHIGFWSITEDKTIAYDDRLETELGHINVGLSPNGKLLATGSWEKSLSLWDVEKRQLLQKLEMEEGYRAVVFSPDGKYLAAGSTSNFFVIFDLAAGTAKTFVVPRVTPETETWMVAYSPDGKYMSTGHNQPYATMWKREDMSYLHFFNGPMAAVKGIAFSRDGSQLASAWGDKKIYLWNPRVSD